MPKVSICIPAYNQPEYLSKTLTSVLMQSYTDYEVIITDDSPSTIVEDMVKSFDFKGVLKYFHNDQPLGSPKNWNYCISKAKGDYIKIMHHDDWFTNSNSLEAFVKNIENTGADFVFCDAALFFEKRNAKGLHCPGRDMLLKLKNDPSILFFRNFVGGPSIALFKRDDTISFDENLKWLVDVDFYIQYLKKHPAFFHIEEPLLTILTDSNNSVTNSCLNNKAVEVFENFYLFNKIEKTMNARQLFHAYNFLFGLLQRFGISNLKEIRQLGYKNSLPFNFIAFFCVKLVNARVIRSIKRQKGLLSLSLKNLLLSVKS
jgi:glycosyltransferase involved in cell wall biosynthesis